MTEWIAVHSLETVGIRWILQIQSVLMPGGQLPLRLLSFMGEEFFFIALITILYWCVDERVGLRLFYFLLICAIVNSIFKWAWGLPRPYWLEPAIQTGYVETGFGAPSGHSQMAFGVWFYLAWLLFQLHQMRWTWGLAAGLAASVSFSRLALGVHFPHDVLSGWILALILLALFIALTGRVIAWTGHGSQAGRTLLLTLITVVLLAGLAWLVQLINIKRIPIEWQANALAAHLALGQSAGLDPYSARTLISTLALLSGAGVALPWKHRLPMAPLPTGRWSLLVRRYMVGMAGFLLLYLGLAWVFRLAGEQLAMELRFLRYFIVALWTIAGAPLLFSRLGLAEAGPSQ
ncbi:MAG: phosphatase PAP2 family protein [Leptospiraceae bacterium]|nr:phosphatase PAP2 family protein [Leptospiraceae bacterium]